MIVEQIWVGNSLRNFNYLIACPDSGEALAIDPLDHGKCLAAAKSKGWSITQVLNTHEHPDHTGGNRQLMGATGAQLLAHHAAAIDGVTRGLNAGEVIKVGRSVELEVLDTPGHTMSHVCLLSHTESPALFCGDTLFNAGAGNCHNGGHPKELYGTFATQLSKLSDATLIYPGHDYISSNLEYTLDREPDNARAQQLLDELQDQDPNEALISTLGLEKQINTFLRLQSPSIIAKLRERFPEIGESPNPETVFLKLRELRNSW